MVQGELFREEQIGVSSELKPRSFLAQYQISITLDKVLIGCIGLVVGLALTYSFGVEKGKRAMEKRMEAYLPSEKQSSPFLSGQSSDPLDEEVLVTSQEAPPASPKTAAGTSVKPVLPAAEAPVNESSLPLVDQTRAGTYTIQLVTYVSEAQALKEIERLNAQGFSGFVIPSGLYFQVCVNYFEKKDLAQGTFKRLQASGRYPGAFVRPVVR